MAGAWAAGSLARLRGGKNNVVYCHRLARYGDYRVAAAVLL